MLKGETIMSKATDQLVKMLQQAATLSSPANLLTN
jgi:hypothetical protein